jgi:3-hydroxyacyl-CoA dehydrogenase
VERTTRDGVAFLRLSNPPVNAINSVARRELRLRLEQLAQDAAATAVVICATGANFSAGGDLKELGKPEPAGAPTMAELVFAMERFAKPVVIALQGRAIGGGVLLAMGCHARVGGADTQLALPEVRLGFVPGVAGTQRLPRLVGLRNALDMVVRARMLAAAEALAAGLLDRIADDPAAGAAELALDIAQGRAPWRRTAALPVPPCEAPSPALAAEFARLAETTFPGREAPLRAIDLILGARDWPFEEGVRREREVFLRLLEGDESKRLVREFFAQRAARGIKP